ncbi:MAG: hypothetical protein ACLP7F_22055 [Acidimicrobiales bacterium]
MSPTSANFTDYDYATPVRPPGARKSLAATARRGCNCPHCPPSCEEVRMSMIFEPALLVTPGPRPATPTPDR